MDTSHISDSVPLESALHELLVALQTSVEQAEPDASDALRACVICRLSARSVERWLRTFLAEYVNDPAARELLRRAQGFCSAHTNVLSSLNEALAIAILYADLARLARERWQQASEPSSASLWRRLRSGGRFPHIPEAPCPACATQQEADMRYVRALAAGLEHSTAQTAVWNVLETNAGLCVPHIEQIAAAATPLSATRLLKLESARVENLQAELVEIIRKNDYRFRGEAWGEEKHAWKRALEKLRR